MFARARARERARMEYLSLSFRIYYASPADENARFIAKHDDNDDDVVHVVLPFRARAHNNRVEDRELRG